MVSLAPTPRGLHIHAVAFSVAAEVVEASIVEDPLPTYFLFGRTIELALKSFLLAEGIPIAKLKSKALGHDLDALFSESERHGISKYIGREAIYYGIVKVLNIDYLSKRFEYRQTGAVYRLPDAVLIRRFINRLLQGIDFYLKTQHRI